MYSNWLEKLNYLKNNISFDRDIEAIFQILKYFLKNDVQIAITNWLDIIQKYNIKDYQKDINFKLLLYDFPIILIEEIGLAAYFTLRTSINHDNKFLLDNNLFNVFDAHAGIYIIIKKYIDITNIKNITTIMYKYRHTIAQDIFDYDILISNIIKLYIENQIIDINYFTNLIKTIKDKKEQIIASTFLIDYI